MKTGNLKFLVRPFLAVRNLRLDETDFSIKHIFTPSWDMGIRVSRFQNEFSFDLSNDDVVQ